MKENKTIDKINEIFANPTQMKQKYGTCNGHSTFQCGRSIKFDPSVIDLKIQ